MAPATATNRPTTPGPLPPSPYGRLFRDGHPWVWVTRAFTALLLLLVLGIVGIVVAKGLHTFWPARLSRFTLTDGTVVTGEEIRRQTGRDAAGAAEEEIQIRIGNRDLAGSGDFIFVPVARVKSIDQPDDLLSFERWEHGPAYGRVKAVYEDGRMVAEGAAALEALRTRMADADRRREERLSIQKGPLDVVSREIEELRVQRRKAQTSLEPDDPALAARLKDFDARAADAEARSRALADRIGAIQKEDRRFTALLAWGNGDPFPKAKPISSILRVDEVNRLGFFGRIGLFVSRFWHFVSDEPREANTDGGIWPAIFGTMLMTLLMTLFVVPFGVIAALYLREYAKQGFIVSAVRIAVNNLAGVPSIVFGVFGLGFFCYFVGGWIDRTFYADYLPAPTFGGGGILWASLTLSLLTVPVVIVSTEEALAAVPRALREAAVACGASKWQTIRRVVLPHASPGILTGMILAMARGAGEVAPLMLTGVVKRTDRLPLDAAAPFLHGDRKFMHLGFHIYDTGFQSPNVDASTPLVYSTTLVLLILVLLLNLGAVVLRNRLRKKFKTGVF
jgi:phosphate transport system permease protein